MAFGGNNAFFDHEYGADNVQPQTPMVSDEANKILVSILKDAVSIRTILASKLTPESEQREANFERDKRHKELIAALKRAGLGGMGGAGGRGGGPGSPDAESKSDWLRKFIGTYLGFKFLGGFIKRFFKFMRLGKLWSLLRGIGLLASRLIWPLAIATAAIWLIPKLIDKWPDIAQKIKDVFTDIWSTISGWVTGFPGMVMDGIDAVSDWLFGTDSGQDMDMDDADEDIGGLDLIEGEPGVVPTVLPTDSSPVSRYIPTASDFSSSGAAVPGGGGVDMPAVGAATLASPTVLPTGSDTSVPMVAASTAPVASSVDSPFSTTTSAATTSPASSVAQSVANAGALPSTNAGTSSGTNITGGMANGALGPSSILGGGDASQMASSGSSSSGVMSQSARSSSGTSGGDASTYAADMDKIVAGINAGVPKHITSTAGGGSLSPKQAGGSASGSGGGGAASSIAKSSSSISPTSISSPSSSISSSGVMGSSDGTPQLAMVPDIQIHDMGTTHINNSSSTTSTKKVSQTNSGLGYSSNPFQAIYTA